jgi:hypothetical protein
MLSKRPYRAFPDVIKMRDPCPLSQFPLLLCIHPLLTSLSLTAFPSASNPAIRHSIHDHSSFLSLTFRTSLPHIRVRLYFIVFFHLPPLCSRLLCLIHACLSSPSLSRSLCTRSQHKSDYIDSCCDYIHLDGICLFISPILCTFPSTFL